MSIKKIYQGTVLKLEIVMMVISATESYAAPHIEGLIDETVNPCISASESLTEQDLEKLIQNAKAMLNPCYKALLGLDEFEKANPSITPSEKNYLFFKGGYVVWLAAAGETIGNNNTVNSRICNQVRIAESLWSRVSVPQGHSVEQEINNYPLRPMLISMCQNVSSTPN